MGVSAAAKLPHKQTIGYTLDVAQSERDGQQPSLYAARHFWHSRILLACLDNSHRLHRCPIPQQRA